MKTPDEIKKGLECCAQPGFNSCIGCPYIGECSDMENIKDALAYIQQLEEDRKERDILADAYQELEAAYPKWISVKERLPEDGQRVVGIAENGMTGIMDYKNDGTPFAARIFGVYFSNITHWLPLPEPPKEGE